MKRVIDMKKEDLVIIEKNNNNLKMSENEIRQRMSKENILLLITVLVLFIAALTVAGKMLSNPTNQAVKVMILLLKLQIV